MACAQCVNSLTYYVSRPPRPIPACTLTTAVSAAVPPGTPLPLPTHPSPSLTLAQPALIGILSSFSSACVPRSLPHRAS